jgi:exodeoxyribonuclease III
MRIVAWNIRHGGGTRVEAIARQLRRWAPDVAALCEFRATPPSRDLARRLAAGGLGHQRTTAEVRSPNDNALLIASRWPLRRIRLSGEPTEPGRWLLVAVAGPQPFLLGAMHVPNRITGRKYPFLDAVLAYASSGRAGPAVLVGDTNCGRRGIDEESPAFNDREDGWIVGLEACGFTDAFRHLHAETSAFTWYSPNAGNGFRIDQAFVNRHLLPDLHRARYAWARTRSRPGRAAVSDHAALLLDLYVGQKETRTLRSARYGRFREMARMSHLPERG